MFSLDYPMALLENGARRNLGGEAPGMNEGMSKLLGLLETRQWSEAWAQYEKCVAAGPPTARLLLMGSHAAYGVGKVHEAKHLAEKALQAWTRTDPMIVLGKIRFHLGYINLWVGDTAVALEQFNLFLTELPQKYPELSMGEGKAAYYLGLVQIHRKEIPAAIEAYRRAIALFKHDGLLSLVAKTRQNLAWLYCQMGESSAARDQLDEARHLLVTVEDENQQILGEAYLAIVEGRPAAAAVICESIYRQLENGVPLSSEIQSQAAWIGGEAALTQHFHESALALANIALSKATESMNSRLMNDASNLRRRVMLAMQAGA